MSTVSVIGLIVLFNLIFVVAAICARLYLGLDLFGSSKEDIGGAKDGNNTSS